MQGANLKMTRAEWLSFAVSALRQHGRATPELDARLILQHHARIDVAELRASPGTGVDATTLSDLERDLQRALTGEPLAYILGRQAFLDFEVEVGPGVLIPRPESEEVVTALMELPGNVTSVLDIATGSGVLLASLLRHFTKANGVGIDISEDALNFARRNCERLGVGKRAELVRGDALAMAPRRFDRVICNPPYIARKVLPDLAASVREFEPRIALDGGEDGLDFYRALAPRLPEFLVPGGWAALEIGYDQGADVPAILESVGGLCDVAMKRDLAGLPRIVLARATQAT